MRHILSILLVLGVVVLSGCRATRVRRTDTMAANPHYTGYSTDQLLDLLTAESITGLSQFEVDKVHDELIRRKDIATLVGRVRDSRESFFRTHVLVNVLFHIDDTLVLTELRGIMSNEPELYMYYVVYYVARTGDIEALRILNENYYQYGVSSWEWSAAVELFGEHRYEPAISNLVGSLDAVSLNVVEAAVHSLERLFPDAKRASRFESLQDLREYYVALYESRD